jgi:membrane fusion protein (multidrug efflux system)
MSVRSTIGLLILLGLLALGAGAAYLNRGALAELIAGGQPAKDRARPPPLVELAVVERREIAATLTATGTLVAPEAVTLTTEANGRVAEIHFEEGDRVERGDLLVMLERDEDQARVDEAEARVVQMRRQVARQTELYDDGFVSAGELERTDAALEEAEAALAIAREALDERGIEAPFGGVTGRRLVSPGAFLRAGSPITRLTQVQSLDLVFEVPGWEIAGLRRGLEVRATTPAYPDTTFRGGLTFIGTEVDEGTRTLPLEATLPNPDGRLKPGMFMDVTLVLGRRETPTVPESAVISRGPSQFVYRLEEEATGPGPSEGKGSQGGPRVSRQPVETGVRRDGWVEIRSGLAAGDRVVNRGQGVLRDDMAVRVAADGGRAGAGPRP